MVQWQRIHLPIQEMQKTRVRPLGREDPWKFPGTEESGQLLSMGRKKLDTTEQLNMHTQPINNIVIVSGTQHSDSCIHQGLKVVKIWGRQAQG